MILFDSDPRLCQWHALVSRGDQWCHSGKKKIRLMQMLLNVHGRFSLLSCENMDQRLTTTRIWLGQWLNERNGFELKFGKSERSKQGCQNLY